MPRYFFHLSAPGDHSTDDVGVEFPDVESAYLDAHQAAIDLSVDMLQRRLDPARYCFEITDQDGQVLFELPFSEIMRPSRKSPRPGSLHADIAEQHARAKHAASELRAAVVRTRSLLHATRQLLAAPHP